MTTNAEPTLSWLHKRNESMISFMVKDKDSVPLFPKEAFIHFIKEFFKLEVFDFSLEKRGWIEAGEELLNMEKDPLVQPLSMGPAEKSDFLCVTTEEDLKASMAVVFEDPSLANFFYEKDKLVGFHYYFMTELCHAVQSSGWYPSLTVKLADEVRFDVPLIQEKRFVLDATCHLSNANFKLRFLIPESTFHSWNVFFAGLNATFDISRVEKTLPLVCSLEIGHTVLLMNDWQKVTKGTFILLDSCLYDSETGEGGAFLCFGGKALFGGKFLKEDGGRFKITNYPTMGFNMEDSELDQINEEDIEVKNESDPSSKSAQEALGKIPLNLIIEVAKYNTTVEEFLKLTPGSILDLGVHPEQGVNLVVNGLKVGRGEVISLGDVLGVRVLELWK